MKRKSRSISKIWLGIVIALLLTACGKKNMTSLPEEREGTEIASPSELETEVLQVRKEAVPDINSVHLRDQMKLYENEDPGSVISMYLTVSRGNTSENTNHSWEDINKYSVPDYEYMGVPRYQVAGLLQVGDESGPVEGELGYGESVPNATVQIRGQSSSENAQKNYKIELKKNKGEWRGQRTINLNKHMTDYMRFRNKLAYDLIEGIPQIMGLRTQFVHLYVKDETDGIDDGFQDYGIYTQVEQLNKKGMKAHGLNGESELYKVNFFEFYRYEDVIKEEDDPSYNQEEFEKYLEIKGSHNHKKLIRMLEAVNDISIPIDDVLERYFDRENLCYWLAFQILMGNHDTQSRNMYLYSPLNSETWYILDWDNDGALKRAEHDIRNELGDTEWEKGISNYWGNVLFQRCLKSDSFREELNEAILDLRAYLNRERVSGLIEVYKNTLKPYLFRMPDSMYMGLTEEQYEEISEELPEEIEENYETYLETLKKPQPFFIGIPELKDGVLHVVWDTAYDFNAESVTYSVEVARDYLFQNLIHKEENLSMPEAFIGTPGPGQYFIRVYAENKSGYRQGAFDYYITDGGKQSSMKCFYIREDGSIEEENYEE